MRKIARNLIIIAVLLIAVKCSKNDDGHKDSEATCFQGLLAVTEEYQESLLQFQENQNETTCNGLKVAAIDLIEAYAKCPNYLQEETNAAFEQAAQEWKNMDCSQN
ncbi:hypothetical protein [Maribacter cobaltidurans]|uniref:Uncharacterized protein n=1 Tax=Maribacter cobaltidurans TaxID=1178778 RepID=A0A223V2X8_9FLAO|nr:hypothetical protein [Maribacter cobaltidurans]ASV29741.1 hypothetical protein CJ263_05635 [Maribacter cobaltidurans]